MSHTTTSSPTVKGQTQAQPTTRQLTFWQARDELYKQIAVAYEARQAYPSGAEMAIFQLLLTNTFWKGTRDYGWVNPDVLGVESIAALAGVSDKTARRALKTLEEHGLIERHKRRRMGHGSLVDSIRVSWLDTL